MRSIAMLCTVLCVVLSASVSAVDLKPEPVRAAMQASIGEMLAQDEFGDLNKGDDASDEAPPPEAEIGGRKSVWKAGLLSAVVPGAGEYYVGNRTKAKFFFAAEAATWLGYAAFRVYSNWKEQDYIDYAALYANARLDGRSDEFHDLVGFYNSIDDYNTTGRIIEPSREYFFDTPENHWQWTSEADREVYRDLKNRSREADRRADFMIGVAVVSRVISVVDAVRDAHNHNKKINVENFGSLGNGFKFSVNPFSSHSQIKLTLKTDF